MNTLVHILVNFRSSIRQPRKPRLQMWIELTFGEVFRKSLNPRPGQRFDNVFPILLKVSTWKRRIGVLPCAWLYGDQQSELYEVDTVWFYKVLGQPSPPGSERSEMRISSGLVSDLKQSCGSIRHHSLEQMQGNRICPLGHQYGLYY